MKTKTTTESFNLLVADDDISNHLLIQEFLIDTGISISFVSNGLEAVRHAKLHKTDLILMDIRMPIMNGFEASGKIRELSPKTKIIIQTSFSREYKNDRVMSSIVDGFLEKPLRKKHFMEEIGKFITLNENKPKKEKILKGFFGNFF